MSVYPSVVMQFRTYQKLSCSSTVELLYIPLYLKSNLQRDPLRPWKFCCTSKNPPPYLTGKSILYDECEILIFLTPVLSRPLLISILFFKEEPFLLFPCLLVDYQYGYMCFYFSPMVYNSLLSLLNCLVLGFVSGITFKLVMDFIFALFYFLS